MTTSSITFDAVAEAMPGAKWRARWDRSWPAYEAWFLARHGDSGPCRHECESALAHHMPELVPVHRELAQVAGGSDRAARFHSTWCPPPYLGGCSVAARSEGGAVRLVRNYDLSPDLNEGLLLRTEWTGMPAMGMVEFLWGLSDGINADGLSVALAFGGRNETARGFGITTILRYVLETCSTVEEALRVLRVLRVLRRIPSHMAYNLVLADSLRNTAGVEIAPGGGVRVMPTSVATNHQHGPARALRPGFTRTVERRAHLEGLLSRRVAPDALADHFLKPPLHQENYDAGFGTLFTGDYDPVGRALTMRWPGRLWAHRLDDFAESRVAIRYPVPAPEWQGRLEHRNWIAAGSLAAERQRPGAARPVPDRIGTADDPFDWARWGAGFAHLTHAEMAAHIAVLTESGNGAKHPNGALAGRRDTCAASGCRH